MNPLRTSLRSTPPNALSRAPSLYTFSYGRSPAYRRLLSGHIASLTATGNVANHNGLASRQPTLLRSSFLPKSIHLQSSSSLNQRSFHVFSPRQAEDGAKTEAKPRQDGKPSEATSEQQKSESAAGEQSRPDQESEGKSDQEKSDQEKSDQEKSDQEKSEGEGEEKKEKKEEPPPPPPHGDKTPWQVFMETMQSEFKQSKEWNESTKALASSAHQFTESESVRKARQAYEATSGAVSSTASTVVKSTAGAIGKGASWTWETPVMKGVRKGANLTGDALDKATQPIRETEAYRNVKDVIDDGSSSRYGGWVEKEERRKKREMEQMKNGKANSEVPQEDPDAGTNVTLHKDAAWKESWRDFRDSNKFVQGVFGMKEVYNESENPLISTARSITDRVAGFFAENETAIVIKKLRSMDPAFQVEPFLRELREYILPEVLDAYVKGDIATLKLWLSEAQYSVYEALTKQYLAAGLKSDGRVLDIRHVDILKARMLEPGEIPVFIITCRTQEVHVYRNAKTNKLAAGMEDKVQLVTYAIGITRIPEDVNNPETRGWRLIEMQKSGRDYI